VKSIIPVVKAAAAVAAIHPEYASNGAHRAADAGSDRAANYTADGPGNPVAFAGAFLRAPHEALSVADMGDREQGKGHCGSRNVKFEGHAGRQCRCPDPGLHLNSFSSAATADAAGICNAAVGKWLRAPYEFRTGRPRVRPVKKAGPAGFSPAAAIFAPASTLTMALQVAGTKAGFRA
jgi:hypothetical protein